MKQAGPISRRLSSIMAKEDKVCQEQAFSTHAVNVRLAVREEDLVAAYHLIYRQYVEYGYMDENTAEMRINYWNLLPTTYTLIAEKHGKVIGTVSYIIDSAANLPMSEAASDVLDRLRTKGRRLCEVSGLAIDDSSADSETIMMMLKYGFHLSIDHLAIDSYVITVSPRHAGFYKRMLAFEQIGKARPYNRVKTTGVPLFLDLLTAEQVCFRQHGYRSGSRNPYRFYFSNTDRLKRKITSDVKQRIRSLSLSLIRRIALKVPGLLESIGNHDFLDRVWTNEEQAAIG